MLRVASLKAFVAFVAVKVFRIAAVLEHVLKEVVLWVGLVVHKLGVSVFVKYKKEAFHIAKNRQLNSFLK